MKKFFATIVFVLAFSGAVNAEASNLCKNSALVKSESFIYTTAAHEQVAVARGGNPEAETVMVFLNGLERDYHQWDSIRDQVLTDENGQKTVQTLQIDLFGQGETAKLSPHTGQVISYERQISLLDEILETPEFSGKKVILVGHSYGGGIGAKFAHEYPGRVDDVFLISPFVDDLETHQPFVGPLLGMTRAALQSWGYGALYTVPVRLASEMAMSMTWGLYGTINQSPGQLPNVVAMTRGILDIGMSHAVVNAGTTKLHLMVSAADEMVPTAGHMALWGTIPKANRGIFAMVLVSHDSPTWSPTAVFQQLKLVIPPPLATGKRASGSR